MNTISVLIRMNDEEVPEGIARSRAIRSWLRDNGVPLRSRTSYRDEHGLWWQYQIEDDVQAVHFKLRWT